MDLRGEVSRILEAFHKTWTYDIHDAARPPAEVVMRDQIHKAPPDMRTRLEAEFFDYGPVNPLLELSGLQEVIINGPDDIWLERSGVFERSPDNFLSEYTFRNFVDRLCSEAGVKIDLGQPFANGRWRGFRLHIACAPLTHCTFHICLRRMPESAWTLQRLEEAGWCTGGQSALLRRLLSERKNVLVIGPTGSGKTSVLGACLKELRPDERTVVIEDTDELPIPNRASTKLLSRPRLSDCLPEVDLAELVKQSLRMRPFRLVVGEVRGAEAKDLLLALATGHNGSWGTLHANEARQALLRLEMLIQLGAPQWSLAAIRQLLHLSVDALVLCGIENGHRRLEGVFRVAALETCGFLLEPMA